MTTSLHLFCQFRQLGYTLLMLLIDAVHFLQLSLRSAVALAAENLRRFLPTRNAEEPVGFSLQIRERDG
jgi:hypothetical protein